MTGATIARQVRAERARQRAKWDGPHDWGIGDCSSPDVVPIVKAAVLTEECGEVVRAVLEGDGDGLVAELVQVIAVCHAWLEGIA